MLKHTHICNGADILPERTQTITSRVKKNVKIRRPGIVSNAGQSFKTRPNLIKLINQIDRVAMKERRKTIKANKKLFSSNTHTHTHTDALVRLLSLNTCKLCSTVILSKPEESARPVGRRQPKYAPKTAKADN